MKYPGKLQTLEEFEVHTPSQLRAREAQAQAELSVDDGLTRSQRIASWACRIIAAAIMLETLFYKFTGAEESVYIFSKMQNRSNNEVFRIQHGTIDRKLFTASATYFQTRPMKTRHPISIEQRRNTKPRVRLLRLQNLVAQERPLPVGRNTARAIVLHLSTTFPACAWAFVRMM